MFRKFLPNSFDFFNLFERLAGSAVEAGVCLKAIAEAGYVDENGYSKIREIEHKADDTTHTIIEQLNKTFITPFDREDIYRLAKEMDDIVDMMNTIVNRLKVYKISGVNKTLVTFANVIGESVRAVECAVKGMRGMKHGALVGDYCIEVNRLENVGDEMRDNALADLFENEKDAIVVIKWKEIYQDAETVLDICEDVAHVVESILVKQG